MYMQSDAIEVKISDCAGTIVINRPDYGNALNRTMIEQLEEALDDLYRERRVRAIIVTGAGESFCRGVDLEELHESADAEQHALSESWGDNAAAYRDLLLRMLEIPKPIIACVHGEALSEGAGLILASDIVIASPESMFGLPDPRVGLVAGTVAPLLCHRVGTGIATPLLLSSVTVDANEAHRIGVFHELIEAEKLWARSMEIAKDCAQGAPEAVQLTKRLLNETAGELLETQLTTGAVMRATSCTTEAAQEGLTAYKQQRPPKWK